MEIELTQLLAPILVTVVTALVSWGLAEASRYIRARTNNENALMAMEDISALTRTVVSEVGQTFKVAAEDGKITAAEGQHMKNIALDRIRNQIPPLVVKHAEKAVNDLEAFIESRIEREVAKSK